MSDTVYNDIPTLEQFQAMSEDELVAMTGYPPEVLSRMRFVRERDAYVAAQEPTFIPPCPSWCTMPADHVYDSVDDSEAEMITFIRGHQTGSGPIAVNSEERNRAGVVTYSELSLYVEIDDPECTADEAREYACQLTDAAEDLERIQRDQATRVILDEQDAVADTPES